MNLPTRVEAIEEMLWSKNSSGIAITQVPYFYSRITLTGGKEDLPNVLTPKREDHFAICAPTRPTLGN